MIEIQLFLRQRHFRCQTKDKGEECSHKYGAQRARNSSKQHGVLDFLLNLSKSLSTNALFYFKVDSIYVCGSFRF